MSQIKLLLRELHARILAKGDPSHAIKQIARGIITAECNPWLSLEEAGDLLAVSVSWLKHCPMRPPSANWRWTDVQKIIQRAKEYSQDDVQPVANQTAIEAQLLRFLVEVNTARANPEQLISEHAIRLEQFRGDRLLTLKHIHLQFQYPIKKHRKFWRLLTPVDLALGKNSRRPFLRYSRHDAMTKRHLWMPLVR